MSREEEYLRRMKALGYEPSLAGMDDGDIEWELSKMEEAERRREAPPQPQRTVYRPVDPGLQARILRQMGQPYDPNAISPKQSFYLNGWDNGEDDENEVKPQTKPLVPQGRKSLTDINSPDFDPWKNVWQPAWGPEGNVLAQPRTMEYRPGRDRAAEPQRYGQSGNDIEPVTQLTAGTVARGASEGSGGILDDVNKYRKKYDKHLGILGTAMNVYNGASDFAKQVEKDALAQHPDKPDLARKKSLEAAVLYGSYQAVLSGGGYALGGGAGTFVAGAAGSLGLDDKVKEEIKKRVMGKSEDDYNKGFDEPLYPGAMPPGPG